MMDPKKEQTIIEIQNLEKSFGTNHVLKGFNMKLHKGENIVVLGKSGCGKSVLIKCIVGLLGYDSGSLKVFENEINTLSQQELDQLRARVGFVFQSGALYDSMTIKENLEFPLRRHGKQKSKKDIDDLISETLQNVGLLHTINMLPSELSGGMRKRISLARALVLHPEIMLYDEPTTGLDTITGKEIIKLMLDMQKKYDMSSIIISHDMHCARETSNKVITLIDGVNYAEGTFNELEKLNDTKVHPFFE